MSQNWGQVQTIVGMSNYLETEPAVPAFVEQNTWLRPLDGETAQHEGAGGVSQFLSASFSPEPDQLEGVRLAEFLFRDNEFGMVVPEDRGRALHHSTSPLVQWYEKLCGVTWRSHQRGLQGRLWDRRRTD